MEKKKILLAYSGGLDTTFCSAWLMKEKGYDVHGVTIDTGGFNEKDYAEIKARATASGMSSLQIIHAIPEYYERCLKFLVFGNVLKNGTYPLSVSAERVIQAIMLAEYALKNNFTCIAHGSTGAGNDQVRFDMLLETLIPEAEIVTPIRDLRLSREEEIAYLNAQGIDIDFKKAAYSVNKGIWGTSVGGKETLTSHLSLPEEAWPTPVTQQESEIVTLHFTEGELTGVNDKKDLLPHEAISLLHSLCAPYGIGRDIHTGDTIIGIKGRVGFEAAAPLVIIKSHHALEKHVLSKWQLYWKDQISMWYGNWLHEGQYFEPVMRDIEAFLISTQKYVTGTVQVRLFPYRFVVEGISSPHDLMMAQKGAYGEMNLGWTGDDVKGFTRIFGQQVKTWQHLHHSKTLQHEKV